MSHDLLVAVTGAATMALAFAFGLPQWLHVRRTGTVAGVSLPSLANTLISTVAWILYGLSLRDVWVTLTSTAALPALLASLTVVLRTGVSRRGMWLPLVWALTLVATAAIGPWLPGLFPAVIGLSILWYVAPAAVTAWLSPDVSGVARASWLLLIVDGSVAGLYGVVADVPAYLVYATVAILGAAAVLARLYWPWTPECGRCAPVTRCTCAVVGVA